MKKTQYHIPGIQRRLIIFLSFIFVFICSFLIRTYICNREIARITSTYHSPELKAQPFIPFTFESAIMYSYSWDVAEGKKISGADSQLVGIDNVKANVQDTLGLEYFLGYGYRLKNLIWPSPKVESQTQPFEDDPYFASWARFQIRLWASLVAGLIFLWLISLRCPCLLALAGGLLHAVSPAAIARYTGQDIVRGEFCLPLVTATFLLAYWFLRRPSGIRLILLGVMTFSAIATWDMCQICFGIWSVSEIIRLLCGGKINQKRRNMWLAIYIAIFFAALTIPYHQTHRLILSPIILVTFPTIISIYCFGKECSYKKRLIVLFISFAVFLTGWKIAASGSDFSSNYEHFANLMEAKLKYNNVKPKDPRLLNFDARMIWVPAMHSADINITKAFFPFALYIIPILIIFLLFSPKKRCALRYRYGLLVFPFFMSAVYFIGYIYIVRYHVFAILFFCILIPLLFHISLHSTKNLIAKIFLIGLFILTLVAEGNKSFILLRDYEGAYFPETAGLIKWFRSENVKGEVILTDFSISTLLKAYCGSRIILHPKFELGQTRKKVEQYLNIIYHGTEKYLLQFCLQHGVKYYIYDRGHMGPMGIYSARYCAAATEIKPLSPVNRMFYKQTRRKLRHFYEIEPPKELDFIDKKFTVFKVITGKDIVNSAKWVEDAKKTLKALKRDTDFASRLEKYQLIERLAKAAVYADPQSYKARILYAEIFGSPVNLQLKGF